MADRMRPGVRMKDDRRKRWAKTYDVLKKEFGNLPENVVLEVLDSTDGVRIYGSGIVSEVF